MLNAAVMEKVNDFRRRAHHPDHPWHVECLLILDPQGQVVWEGTDGDDTGVEIPHQYRVPGLDLIHVHNHPIEGPPSIFDLANICRFRIPAVVTTAQRSYLIHPTPATPEFDDVPWGFMLLDADIVHCHTLPLRGLEHTPVADPDYQRWHQAVEEVVQKQARWLGLRMQVLDEAGQVIYDNQAALAEAA